MALSNSGLFAGGKGMSPAALSAMFQSGMFAPSQGDPGLPSGGLVSRFSRFAAPSPFRVQMPGRPQRPIDPTIPFGPPIHPTVPDGGPPGTKPIDPNAPPPGTTPRTPPTDTPFDPNGPNFGPFPPGQEQHGPAGLLAGPPNGTWLDDYRTPGRDYGGAVSSFTGIDPKTGQQFINGHLYAAESQTSSGDKSVMGKAFHDILAAYGLI
jgi:hypothetical protein